MPNEEYELLNISNLAFVEEAYRRYIQDPTSVSPEWRQYFRTFPESVAAPRGLDLIPPPGLFGGNGRTKTSPEAPPTRQAVLQERVDQLVHAYRVLGHEAARLNPIGPPAKDRPQLDPAFYGFTPSDMERRFSCAGFDPEPMPLREIVRSLRETYCRSIGVQYMHIVDPGVRRWLQERMESSRNRLELERDEQLRILTWLTDATIFEQFMRRKFIGAKTFSLEGAETLIPLLDIAFECAAEQGVDEIVMAMAHRGRLNVLANILGKPTAEIFREFETKETKDQFGRGDVRYHLGHSAAWTTTTGRNIHLSLCFNPSHLEFVNPVAVGRMRAKQDRVGDEARLKGLVILIHGDAAFAGEGVVQETLNLSALTGYTVGGALHLIVNNQIGFTTPPQEYTSSQYATGVARLLPIPIFHVNGEDPEAVAHVVRLAMEFRRTFASDVVVDMYCYRRMGHNESDEPSFTQPLQYNAIEERVSVREGYLDFLLNLGEVTRTEADRIAEDRQRVLNNALTESQSEDYVPSASFLKGVWEGYCGGLEPEDEVDTGVDATRLAQLLLKQIETPRDFNVHPKIQKGMAERRRMASGERPLDWAAAESLAFASLAIEGVRIRMSGQDTERGTFGNRHAVLHDVENGRRYIPLQNLTAAQAPIEIYNSPLSEAGVLGFEYGYSLDCPDGLTLWEAQFGDFSNAAQVIIDQFITSAEDKWNRLSGIVLLLPHGFEGMGPEHSSARLERFLSLAAEDNIQIVYPTTPAQYFHVLRRQGLRKWKKPLVVLTPKSLLRSSESASALNELSHGRFQKIIPDRRFPAEPDTRRILLCSGKIYFDLKAEREERKAYDVAIVRLEQFYPVADELIADTLERYRKETPVVWVQEEPRNMGAWTYLLARYGSHLPGGFALSCISRPESASPATGSVGRHRAEQRRVLSKAFE